LLNIVSHVMVFTWTYSDCRWWRTETADDTYIPRWRQRFWDATEVTALWWTSGKRKWRKKRQVSAATETCCDNEKQT